MPEDTDVLDDVTTDEADDLDINDDGMGESGGGITHEDLYPEDAPVEPDGETSKESSTLTGEEAVAHEEPAGDQEAAGEAEVDTEADEADDPVEPMGWDPKRQKRDEEAANERKAGETELATLRAERDRYKTAAEAQETADKAKEELDEFSPDEDVTTAHKRLVKQTRTLEANVKELQANAKSEADMREVRAQAEMQQQWAAYKRDSLAAQDKLYGPDTRNKGTELANQFFADQGYTEDAPPGPEAMIQRIALERLTLREAKKGTPKPKGAGVRVDTGTSGSPAKSSQAKDGSNVENVRNMIAEGKKVPRSWLQDFDE